MKPSRVGRGGFIAAPRGAACFGVAQSRCVGLSPAGRPGFGRAQEEPPRLGSNAVQSSAERRQRV
jgi:hypothetical protein